MQPDEGSLRRPFKIDDSDSDEDEKHARKRPVRTRKGPKLAPPLYKASVTALADTASTRPASSATADIDDAIILRIRKCLDRAKHPNTPEAEAKAALHVASRLMGQYNVSQAEVLAHVPPDAQKQYAGQTVVSITRTDGDTDKPVRQQTYVNNLCWAMQEFFSCKYYSTARRSSVELTFYGIAENSVAAAMAFEMAYNLIAEWARAYKGVGSKNSYCHGVCDQLVRDARRAKAQEEAQAKRAELEAIADTAKQEEADTAARLARLEQPPAEDDVSIKSSSPEPQVKAEDDDSTTEMVDGDSEDEDLGQEDPDSELEDFWQPNFEIKEEGPLDLSGDLDLEIENLVKEERQSSEVPFDEVPPLAGPPDSTEKDTHDPEDKEDLKASVGSAGEFQLLETNWQSHGQLVLFRDTSARIAENYLKEQGVKLHKGRKRTTTIHDSSAYQQGKRDSSKIDVHRKRLTSE
ncbi:uncharacterized protein B0I36DRAFT_338490 [Microdochium trichocladiopsis]|uniref:DUF2786 domain-containing protein n=1 Tax=Microdochium trichocladiopsis TaxID=1682393 RepID=A0A9P8XRQ4_9PEZI|nr:uncharacterized protein B0I36DRAFT_338490 [Microdochium trichocladiopsis]KAH7014270.1 hypothetical protein B0I36DRAFT_338490 [Microdochium trichocladiopsis]